MTFANKEDLQNFLEHKKYYKSPDNYCLGSSLKDAGEVISTIKKSCDEKKQKGLANYGSGT